MTPSVRTRILRIATICGILVAAACARSSDVQQQQPDMNTLTDDERPAGWSLLFDGKSLAGWRGLRSAAPPAGWQVVDGNLTRVGGGGDLVSVGQYGDFELRLEWNVSEGGNSGIMFRVDPNARRTFESGPEMQVLDDERHPDGRSRLTSAGSNYGLHPAPEGHVRPPGEWNAIRLVARGAHVEHWLNGTKILEYELWSPEWETLVANSKFVEWPGYGRATRGHIVLQDHGDWVAYRNIKLRDLTP